jgi:hypothetical protein
MSEAIYQVAVKKSEAQDNECWDHGLVKQITTSVNRWYDNCKNTVKVLSRVLLRFCQEFCGKLNNKITTLTFSILWIAVLFWICEIIGDLDTAYEPFFHLFEWLYVSAADTWEIDYFLTIYFLIEYFLGLALGS